MITRFTSGRLFLKLTLATACMLAAGLFLHTPKAEAATCSTGAAFKMTVKTDNPGTTTSTQFRIPLISSGYTYKVDINGDFDWADTSVGAGWNETTDRLDSAVTIDFGAPGTYAIGICGTFPRIYFNNAGDKDKVIAITQWGDNAWTSMASAFYGASNMDVTATDAPNLSGVTALTNMFVGTTSLIGNSSFNSWNTGSVTSMRSMFRSAPNFNQPIGSWNISNVNDISYILYGATAFNQDISAWNTSAVTNMERTFRDATSFNKPLNTWNTSAVTNMAYMFDGASAFNQPLNSWNVSNVTNMSFMFSGVTAGTAVSPDVTITVVPMSFNQDISAWNTGNVTNMSSMFGSDPGPTNAFYASTGYTNITNVDGNYISPFNQNISGWNMSNIIVGTGLSGVVGMLSRTAITPVNYDAILTGWSIQNLQLGNMLGAVGLQYCTSRASRELIISKGWTIDGDSYYCAPAPGVPDTGIAIKQPQSQKTVFIAVVVIFMAGVFLKRFKVKVVMHD